MSPTDVEQESQFGYELLREGVLREILGEHESDILYWAGKSLARSYPLDSLEEAADFFRRAGFGELEIEKQKKSETVFLLKPLKTDGRCFKLEAGFLAEQKQALDGVLTEAHEESLPKKQRVRITLQSDLREKL